MDQHGFFQGSAINRPVNGVSLSLPITPPGLGFPPGFALALTVLNGMFQFTDSSATNFSRRFYRVRSP